MTTVDYAPPDLTDSHLYNADLAPTTAEQRKWSVWAIAALWISMSACIPTYSLASGLIAGGMNWWQAVGTIFAGNAVVLIPMVLNGFAGTKYGIPFPVYCRAAFGTRGANLPAMLRALIACGWFGIQTWIGGSAIFAIAVRFHPAWADPTLPMRFGITQPQFICFMSFWAVNMIVIMAGIDSIRILLDIKAPLLIFLGLLLLGWAGWKVHAMGHGIWVTLNQRSTLGAGDLRGRCGGILGDIVAEHSGLHTLCQIAARSGHRSGDWVTHHDGALLVHWRGGHQLHRGDFWSCHLGSG
jgi:NCS1 family nucleobase:cation symporter-1